MRRFAVMALGLATAMAALAACGSTATSGKSHVVSGEPPGGEATASVSFGIYPGTFLSLVPWVASAENFYKQNGLNVTLDSVSTGPQMTAELAGHSVDFVTNSVDNLVLARKQGLNAVYVGGGATSFPFVLIARQGLPVSTTDYPEVMHSLQGKKIGVLARGGSLEFIVRDMLNDAGMKPSDVVFIAAGGPSQAIASLKSGAIDAYISYDPTQTIAEVNGFGKPLVDMSKGQGPADLRNVDYNGVWALQSYVSSHENVVQRFAKAQLQAACWIHNPSNLNALVALAKTKIASTGLSDAQFTAMIQHDVTDIGGTFRKASIDKWSSFLLKYHETSAPLQASQLMWSGTPQTNPYC